MFTFVFGHRLAEIIARVVMFTGEIYTRQHRGRVFRHCCCENGRASANCRFWSFRVIFFCFRFEKKFAIESENSCSVSALILRCFRRLNDAWRRRWWTRSWPVALASSYGCSRNRRRCRGRRSRRPENVTEWRFRRIYLKKIFQGEFRAIQIFQMHRLRILVVDFTFESFFRHTLCFALYQSIFQYGISVRGGRGDKTILFYVNCE